MALRATTPAPPAGRRAGRRERRQQRRLVEPLREVVGGAAEVDGEGVADEVEVVLPEFRVDRQVVEEGPRGVLRDVLNEPRRRQRGALQPLGDLCPRRLPEVRREALRHRVAPRRHLGRADQPLDGVRPDRRAVVAQRRQHGLRDVDEADRIVDPPRGLDGVAKALLLEQLLRHRAGAGAGVFEDALLHDEGGALVDEVGERHHVGDRRRLAEQAGDDRGRRASELLQDRHVPSPRALSGSPRLGPHYPTENGIRESRGPEAALPLAAAWHALGYHMYEECKMQPALVIFAALALASCSTTKGDLHATAQSDNTAAEIEMLRKEGICFNDRADIS
jgi:hypothetical protein